MATTKKVALPKDPTLMLAYLVERYTFTPAINQHLKTLRLSVDPLLTLPSFFLRDEDDPKVPEIEVTGRWSGVELGVVDGHGVAIYRFLGGRTEMRWGCREITSEADARDHWRNNKSRQSGYDRPHAAAVIDFVRDVCRHRGWKW